MSFLSLQFNFHFNKSMKVCSSLINESKNPLDHILVISTYICGLMLG